MKQQTAVEWLIEQFKDYDFTPASNNEEYVIIMPQWIFNAKRDEAKEMEKQQMIDAVKYGYNGHKIGHYTPNFREQQELFEQYYNETFKK